MGYSVYYTIPYTALRHVVKLSLNAFIKGTLEKDVFALACIQTESCIGS